MKWQLHHNAVTVSTNLDARVGVPFDVFTADYQSAGRGRLDHKWLAPPATCLLMSVVLPVVYKGRIFPPEQIATLPLAVGLSVLSVIRNLGIEGVLLKWPNDVLIGDRKVAGILCERNGDVVIAGIGINVKKRDFPPDLQNKATFIGGSPYEKYTIEDIRDLVLESLGIVYEKWIAGGFDAIYAEIQAVDYLRGQTLEVLQTDDDDRPIVGECGGIQADGSLKVGNTNIYAGEAHVKRMRI